jgi:signal peptidase I
MSLGGRTGFGDGRAVAAKEPAPKGVLRDYIETIIVCVIFVIFSRTFVFQQSKIPSGSMEDTLLIGDYIMVNRFIYAPTSFDWERKLLPVRDVHRGDVVVFKFPAEPEIDYIKRIVGLPGDTVEVRDGYLFVNGTRANEPYVNPSYRHGDSFGPIKVDPASYFAMGDHRDRSADSRVWGFVPQSLLKGRALLIWWSYDEDSAEANPRGVLDSLRAIAGKAAHFLTRSRWSRCFTLIR